MMEKYYTPKLEEFHQGFRYQLYIPGTNTEYSHEVFNFAVAKSYLPVINSFMLRIDGGWIRVKYLDEADIVELGWVKRRDDDTGVKSFYKEDYMMLTYSDSHKVFLYNNGSKFEGEVRNFNELQRLMEQLGIK